MTVSYVAFDIIQEKINKNIEESNESFKILTNIFDATLRLFRNFQLNITHMFSDFKRSELQVYHESHILALHKLYNEQNPQALKGSVVIPEYMSVTYYEAATSLLTAYKTLDIGATISSIMQYLDTLEHTLNDQDSAIAIRQINVVKEHISKFSRDKLNILYNTLFSKSQTEKEMPIKEVIGSFNNLKKIDESIKEFDDIFRNTIKVNSDIKTIETKINNIVTNLENSNNIDNKYLTALHDFVVVAAEQLDSLGTITHLMQMVEHNFVLALDKISKKNLNQ